MTHAPKPATGRSADRWENEGGLAGLPAAPRPHSDADLDTHGIVPVELTVFDWGGDRYSSAKDAIAAARRSRAPRSDF